MYNNSIAHNKNPQKFVDLIVWLNFMLDLYGQLLYHKSYP